MSLANKYRPKSFDDVVWQNHITDILKAKVKSEWQSWHNFLFFWGRWIGKTTCARILAKAINCSNLQNWNPCNECINCQSINSWTTLDYVEIDAASHTWVDNIRSEILDRVPYPPTHLKKKVYVIDEVHMLSKWAFNALLKTIEEPSEKVCFILATTEIHKIPDTIISRCQVFNFKKANPEILFNRLQEICKKENIQYSNEALKMIAKISEWWIRDAVKYVDQIQILWNITEENISKFLWVAPDSLISEFLKLIQSHNHQKIVLEIDKISEQWIDMRQFAKQILLYIDQNFNDDITWFLPIAKKFSQILSMMKYYPYPTIVYKIILTDTNIESNETQVSKPTETKNPTVQNELLQKVFWKVNKDSLKKNLEQHVILEKIEWNQVSLIVINKMTEMLVQKPENINEIEQIFSTELWMPVQIKIEFKNKEKYLTEIL